jgi:hypothetical protein
LEETSRKLKNHSFGFAPKNVSKKHLELFEGIIHIFSIQLRKKCLSHIKRKNDWIKEAFLNQISPNILRGERLEQRKRKRIKQRDFNDFRNFGLLIGIFDVEHKHHRRSRFLSENDISALHLSHFPALSL